MEEETKIEEASILPEDKKDIEENKGIALLSYLGILCLVPLLVKKESKFCQFHAKQGLILFIGEAVITLLNIIPFIGQIIWVIGIIIALIASITGIIKALAGEYWEMPVLGEYAKKIKV